MIWLAFCVLANRHYETSRDTPSNWDSLLQINFYYLSYHLSVYTLRYPIKSRESKILIMILRNQLLVRDTRTRIVNLLLLIYKREVANDIRSPRMPTLRAVNDFLLHPNLLYQCIQSRTAVRIIQSSAIVTLISAIVKQVLTDNWLFMESWSDRACDVITYWPGSSSTSWLVQITPRSYIVTMLFHITHSCNLSNQYICP
jgi:hypothetical protein